MENHWAKLSVNEMGSRLIINGKTQELFGPEDAITRAEFTAIIVNALGLRGSSKDIKYSDINQSDWFCQAVIAANEYGLISGYPDGSFKPYQTITREQAMALIARTAELVGMDTSVTDLDLKEILTKIRDTYRLGNWSQPSAAFCIQHKIVVGNQGIIEPDRNITRAQSAVIIMRLLQETELI
jgi:hypothetical protein